MDTVSHADRGIVRVGNAPLANDEIWKTATSLGYRVERHLRADYPSSHALERVLLHRGLRALVVTACYEDHLRFRPDWSQFIGVALGTGSEPPPIHRVDGDKFGAMTMAYERAWAAGRRRIGAALYRHPVHLRDDDLRHGAYHACAARCGSGFASVFEFGPDWEPHGIGAWAVRERLDCVIGFTGSSAWRLIEEGVRVPRDVAFVTLHHQHAEAALAGTADDHAFLQRTAVLRLHQLVRAGAYGSCNPVVTDVVEPVWQPGPSLPERTG